MSLFYGIPLVLSGQWEERRRELKESAFTAPNGVAPFTGDYHDMNVPLPEKKGLFFVPQMHFFVLAPWTQT